MAVASLKYVTVIVKINNGTDSEGNIRTANISLGNMSEWAYDDNKALRIVSALAPCLKRSITAVERTSTYTLSAD